MSIARRVIEECGKGVQKCSKKNEVKKNKLHSQVDLITNSSTEIFMKTNEDSVQTVKRFINSILKASECGKTCDDLFTINHKESDIVITAKDGTSTHLNSLVQEIFNIDAEYNG